MATTQGEPGVAPSAGPRSRLTDVRSPQDAQGTIAKVWVVHGTLWLILIAYVWTRWIASSSFKVNTTGRGLEPTWYLVAVWVMQIGFGVLFSGWIIWHYILGPKLRTGRFSFDGLFFLACWLMFFQEPWNSWINLQFLYSTAFVNFGSWLNHTPGWSLPNAQLIPVPLVYGMAYLWMVGFGAWAGSKYMSRQRSKDPGRSVGRLLWQTFFVMVIVDLVGESIMVHLQLISYPRTIPSLTLWAGTDHQFPLYELLAWPGTFLCLSSMHFFRDDQGRSWPERGVDKIGIKSQRLTTFARFAALVGFCQLAILICFNIPYQIYGMHAGPVPKSILHEPWRLGGVCGPGTAYNCGGPGVLVPRSDTPTNRVVLQKTGDR